MAFLRPSHQERTEHERFRLHFPPREIAELLQHARPRPSVESSGVRARRTLGLAENSVGWLVEALRADGVLASDAEDRAAG